MGHRRLLDHLSLWGMEEAIEWAKLIHHTVWVLLDKEQDSTINTFGVQGDFIILRMPRDYESLTHTDIEAIKLLFASYCMFRKAAR